jgi:hypothetical protein
MHRTYSMRQSRAPTASQIENPPPPMSSTKSNRWLGKGGIGEWHTIQTVILVSSTVVEVWLLSKGGVPRSPKQPDWAYSSCLRDSQPAIEKHRASNEGITRLRMIADICSQAMHSVKTPPVLSALISPASCRSWLRWRRTSCAAWSWSHGSAWRSLYVSYEPPSPLSG